MGVCLQGYVIQRRRSGYETYGGAQDVPRTIAANLFFARICTLLRHRTFVIYHITFSPVTLYQYIIKTKFRLQAGIDS